MVEFKKILVLDFDGVLHSYTSGWKGAAVIPDPPVPGALEWLVLALRRFDVAIVSARSHQWGGRRAMKRWLRKWMADEVEHRPFNDQPDWVQKLIMDSDLDGNGFARQNVVARSIVKRIAFPRHKPPAHVTLDDRAITFNGVWPDLLEVAEFKPWNKR